MLFSEGPGPSSQKVLASAQGLDRGLGGAHFGPAVALPWGDGDHVKLPLRPEALGKRH